MNQFLAKKTIKQSKLDNCFLNFNILYLKHLRPIMGHFADRLATIEIVKYRAAAALLCCFHCNCAFGVYGNWKRRS